MLLSLQTAFSFVRAAVACAILEKISCFKFSIETIAPRNIKLVTGPSFCPFILKSHSGCHWRSARISILYLVQGCRHLQPGPEVLKLFPCSNQLSMKFFLLINVKNANNCWHFNIYERENNILGLSAPKKTPDFFLYFYTYEHLKFHAQLS